MSRGTQGHQRKPGTTQIELEITSPTTTSSAQIQNRIDNIDAQIATLQEQRAELVIEKATVAALEPNNVAAVSWAIEQLDFGQTPEQVEADLLTDPWNLEPADAAEVVLDAVEIIAERGN